jgi:phosphoenolpyruvate synthase/pyruvate phosphate dikinase
MSIDIQVPAGVAITSLAFDDFILTSSLSAKIQGYLDDVAPFSRQTAREASEKIVNLIKDVEISKAIKDSIFQNFQSLMAENSPHSVQLEISNIMEEKFIPEHLKELSVSDINDEESLLEAVKFLWASLFSTESIEMRSVNYYKGPITVAILMRQVRKFEITGNGYSIPPITKETDQVEITARYGIDDPILNSETFEDSYKIDIDSLKIVQKNIVPQDFMIIRKGIRRGEKVTVMKVEISKEWKQRQKLDDETILSLVEILKDLEKRYKNPIEISWGIEAGEIYITDIEVVPRTDKKHNPAIKDEKEFLSQFGVKGAVTDRDLTNPPQDLIETEAGRYREDEDEVLKSINAEKEWELYNFDIKKNIRAFPDWSDTYSFTTDVFLDISKVDATTLHLMDLFNGTYFDVTDSVVSIGELPEDVFPNQRKRENWVQKLNEDITLAMKNTHKGGLIYQFSNPNAKDFKKKKVNLEYYGDERFIQYPEALIVELQSLALAQKKDEGKPLSICVPYVRSLENIEDINRIIKSKVSPVLEIDTVYAEVAIPSFAYDVIDANEKFTDGIIINYDVLLRISVYRSKPRPQDHRVIIRLIEEMIHKCKRNQIKVLIKLADIHTEILDRIIPLRPHGYIFSSIPSEADMRKLAGADVAQLKKSS